MNRIWRYLVLASTLAILLLATTAVKPAAKADGPTGYPVVDVKFSKDNSFEVEDNTIAVRSAYGYNIVVGSVGPRSLKYPGKRFPLVLRIGGGFGPGNFMLNHPLTKLAASYGLIVVAFDAEPKIKIIPPQLNDFNGFKDQDDVATVLQRVFENPSVSPNGVGVWSHSNGVTLAAGVLGREEYQELSEKVVFLLDDEGPHCPKPILESKPDLEFRTKGMRDAWKGVIEAKVGAERDYESENEFFSERCADRFIGNYKGIYQRVQAKDDHEIIGYHGHAVAMLNAATKGKAKWTRLNQQPKIQIYASAEEPHGIDIASVLDVAQFLNKPNDSRIWDVLFDVFHELDNE